MWSREKMAKVINVCIIMHNMVVEMRRDRYESEIWLRALSAAGRREVLDENGNEIPFKWACTDDVSNRTTAINTVASTVAIRDVRITGESQHFLLKADLVEHIWQNFTDK